MKPLLQCIGVRLALIFVMGAGLGVATTADDLENLFQMGRTAYYRGDLEQAQQLLFMVAQQNPRHQETRILLGDIRAKLKASSGSSLKKRYEGVKIAKIEFAEAKSALVKKEFMSAAGTRLQTPAVSSRAAALADDKRLAEIEAKHTQTEV